MAQDHAATLPRPDGPPEPVRSAEAAYTHTETAPQRLPRTPDTPWGRLRARSGWSLRGLAERTGINPGELSRIERGHGGGATPEQARRLLAVFDEADA